MDGLGSGHAVDTDNLLLGKWTMIVFGARIVYKLERAAFVAMPFSDEVRRAALTQPWVADTFDIMFRRTASDLA